MQFLDIYWTKDSNLLIYAIHSLSQWCKSMIFWCPFGSESGSSVYEGRKPETGTTISQKTRVFCSMLFTLPSTTEKWGWETPAWEDSSLCSETSTKNAVQEFHHRKNAAVHEEIAQNGRVSVFVTYNPYMYVVLLALQRDGSKMYRLAYCVWT